MNAVDSIVAKTLNSGRRFASFKVSTTRTVPFRVQVSPPNASHDCDASAVRGNVTRRLVRATSSPALALQSVSKVQVTVHALATTQNTVGGWRVRFACIDDEGAPG